MASIAMWSAPQFKAYTHILVNTTNKNRSIVKEMQEPLTSPFYWVLFGLMLLFFGAGFEFNSCLAFCIHAFHFIHSLFSALGFLLRQQCIRNASAQILHRLPGHQTQPDTAYQWGQCLDAIWCTRVFRFHQHLRREPLLPTLNSFSLSTAVECLQLHIRC